MTGKQQGSTPFVLLVEVFVKREMTVSPKFHLGIKGGSCLKEIVLKGDRF